MEKREASPGWNLTRRLRSRKAGAGHDLRPREARPNRPARLASPTAGRQFTRGAALGPIAVIVAGSREAGRRSSIRATHRGPLADLGLIGQVWPVYRSDASPPVLGLMVSRAMALAEIIFTAPEITDADLVRSLRCFHVMEGNVEADLIRRPAPADGHYEEGD